ncbi:hypothetical protein [Roseomonas sp. KE0001]|uniref:hypothetical protein n=1 Tax=Roseomonas sp. KE0001 TaxID=2479201 RepID=UPI0018DEFAB6|nr:hypothetical protein [Roseomonas sp. KE0001]
MAETGDAAMRCRIHCALLLAGLALAAPRAAEAQLRLDHEGQGYVPGPTGHQTGRQGGTPWHFESRGLHGGRPEHPAGGAPWQGGADGRHRGWQEIPRDLRRRPPGQGAWGPGEPGTGQTGSGVQVYVDPGPLVPPPVPPPEFPASQGTPWFGDREPRPRR